MNEHVYIGLSMLGMTKMAMSKYWYQNMERRLNCVTWLYVLVISRTRFRVNPHSLLA